MARLCPRRMEDDEPRVQTEMQRAQPAGAGSGAEPENSDPSLGLKEGSHALETCDPSTPAPPVIPEEQEVPRQSLRAPVCPQEQGEDLASRPKAGCSEEQDVRPRTTSADPEELLLRCRNRQRRGLAPSNTQSSPCLNGPASQEQDEEGVDSCRRRSATVAHLGTSADCTGAEEPLMRDLSRVVQGVVRGSSWWERHGVDCALLAMAFIFLPAGFMCLRSYNVVLFLFGILILGVAHSIITVKGSHLSSHGALAESKYWSKFWATFFIEVCGGFPTQVGAYNHVKMHHAHTNIIGLGDSSVWKIPALNRLVYLFLAPLALPVLTPLAALGFLKDMSVSMAARTLCLISLGLGAHYWLLLNVSGFQHIGLAMFPPDHRPRRIHQMSHGVLNLPRNLMLDWTFGHSLISCHVEHHLFPHLSDNMCLKIKPYVSEYLKAAKLPYQEDAYLSRLRLFLDRYNELMVHMPPITQMVGIQ
ncbi:fatty acid desaturase 6 isoform X2 [Ambystoma mexicanum]|uniref:fatty acid desaturase 6 isoform X2 n=1 Tax=Ambystoma mexicanum TaxID=8296 RepID=UPI0037E89975